MWHKISQVPHIRRWASDGLKLPSRHIGTSCVPKEPSHGSQTTLQDKAGHLVTVMDDWKQLDTNATLLYTTKHCHSLFKTMQGHEKQSGKSRPGYL